LRTPNAVGGISQLGKLVTSKVLFTSRHDGVCFNWEFEIVCLDIHL